MTLSRKLAKSAGSRFAVAAAREFFCCTGQYLFAQDGAVCNNLKRYLFTQGGAAFYRLKKKITDCLKRA